MYVHTHIHTHIHTYIHTYVRTYVHTYIHTYTYIHTTAIAPAGSLIIFFMARIDKIKNYIRNCIFS